jgi:hypothetical protein
MVRKGEKEIGGGVVGGERGGSVTDRAQANLQKSGMGGSFGILHA